MSSRSTMTRRSDRISGLMTKRRLAIAAAGAAALAATAATVWMRTARAPGGDAAVAVTASGTVESVQAEVGFPLAGRIDSLAVREGDPVARGDLLARLDRAELEASLASARARVAAAEARLDELREGSRPEELAQARAARAATARRLADAEREIDRASRLYEGGAVSRQSWENAETALEIARSEHDRASARLRLLEAGPRTETIAAQAAAVRQARAAAEQIRATLENTELRAPFDGIAAVRHRDPGEIVAPGAPIVTVRDPDDRWVRIYVQGDRVGLIGLGHPAVITDDAHPGRSYTGVVVHIADEAEFTPRNVQTREERVKLVYAVEVAITGDPDADLKSGLPVDVRLLAPDDADAGGGEATAARGSGGGAR